MELKIVYRALRKISDWSIAGLYSDIYVEGQENVTRDGPLIIASTHHNEMIDIANLAATIPHRRHVSFWAKSSMFVNPIARAIMLSSGAIPVKRNPNNGNGNGNGASPQASLFRESSIALAAGEVIGVFPEGTSYTQPSIVQVMSGAAWAAVDYIKWSREQNIQSKELTIVPVGIVYTDKARYQSRVCIRYGVPIIISKYTEDIFKEGADLEAATKLAVKHITAEIEKQMRAMSVNAPDWDTLHAAQMARDIIYEDPARIPLKDWVSVSQSLIDTFTSSPSPSATLDAAKAALTKYHALLHYTGISHLSLSTILPVNPSPLPICILSAALHAPFAFLGFLFFVPPMVVHIPAYLTGCLAARLLTKEGELESQAQFKAIFGGVGLGIGLGAALSVLKKFLSLESAWSFIAGGVTQEGLVGAVKRAVGVLGVAYSSVYLLVRWHNALVYSNYQRLKTLLTLHKLCLGLVPQHPASPSDLKRYMRTPIPPPNRFIKKILESNGPNRSAADVDMRDGPTVSVPTRKLIRPLLAARKKALATLEAYLMTRADDEATRFLSRMKELV